MLKILLLGSSGFLGSKVYNNLKKNKKFKIIHVGIIKKKYDLSIYNNLEKVIINSKPNLIINASGQVNIDKCESQPKKSKVINVKLLENIFKIKRAKNLKFNLIQISTDQLYDQSSNKASKESDKVRINNQYSKQKYMAEKICMNNNSLVLRVNFYGNSKKNKSFLNWVYDSFKSKEKFYLFNDVFFNPLSVNTLAKIIKKIIEKKMYKKKNIINLGTKDGIFKHSLAINFANKKGIYNKNYSLVSVNKFSKVKKSKNMFMDVKKIERILKIKMPSSKTELNKTLKEFV